MRYLLLLIAFFAGTACFTQPFGNFGRKQQYRIDTYIDSLKQAGALDKDTVSLSGEKIDSFPGFAGGTKAWLKYVQKSNLSWIMDQAVGAGIPSGD